MSILFRRWIHLPSQFCVCDGHKSHELTQGKFAVGQRNNRENTGNLEIQFEWGPFPVNIQGCDISTHTPALSHLIGILQVVGTEYGVRYSKSLVLNKNTRHSSWQIYCLNCSNPIGLSFESVVVSCWDPMTMRKFTIIYENVYEAL